MKKLFMILIIVLLTISILHPQEKKDKNIIDKVIEFFFKPKPQEKPIDLQLLKDNIGVQENYCINKNGQALKEKEAKNKLDANDYLEKAIIENNKGNKEAAKENYEKAVTKQEKEKFVFNEDLAMMLAGQYAEDYDISKAKALLVKDKTKELTESEKKEELKRLADIFFNRIKSSYEAKQMIENLIEKQEYEVVLEVIEKSYSKKYIEKDYYDEKKKLVMGFIEEMNKKETAKNKEEIHAYDVLATTSIKAEGPGKDAYSLLGNAVGNTPITPDLDGLHKGVKHITEERDEIVGNYFKFIVHRDQVNLQE